MASSAVGAPNWGAAPAFCLPAGAAPPKVRAPLTLEPR